MMAAIVVPVWAGALLLAVLAIVAGLFVRQARRRLHNERRLRTEAEQAAIQASNRSGVAVGLSRAKTSAEVIESALAGLLHNLGADAGAAALRAGNDELQVDHVTGFEATELEAGRRLPSDRSTPVNDALHRHELVVIESRMARAVEYPQRADDDFLGSYAASVSLPLSAGTKVLGIIALGFHQPRTFTGEERSFLLDAGRNVAQALIRANEFDAAERAREASEDFRSRAAAELRERERAEDALRDSEAKYRALAARSARLYELSAALSEAVTPASVATVIVRQGKAVVGASAAAVAMLVDDGREFETLAAAGYAGQEVEAWYRFRAEPGLCSTAAAQTRAPVFVSSLSEWQQRYPRSGALAADGGYASAAVLPLMAEGNVLGVLSLHFVAPISFNDEYAALLRAIVQHCSQALDRARLYEATQQARADAESANRAKDDFLSTISHELRTPLNAMLGWASMLRHGALDATRSQRAVEAIHSNATRQAQLIEDLLDVSRIIAGRAPLDLQEFPLADTLRGAVDAIMPQAESKGLELRLERIPTVVVTADPRRLEQVFLNLLTNAVKFTPEGGRITVGASMQSEGVNVRVTDTGAGIDPEFLPHVFERFRQGDSSLARRVGGLGLGLFIARHLVEAQGGSISVESDGRDRGSTFSVRLPLRAPASVATVKPAALEHAAAAEDLSEPLLRGIRVLLVDDEPDAREVMASVLETSGATVTPVESARVAIQTLADSEFDVLLADLAMPEEDGYRLIREVRALPTARVSTIPAAAVTACAGKNDQRQALDAGFQIHIAKPVAASVLVRTVVDLLLRHSTVA